MPSTTTKTVKTTKKGKGLTKKVGPFPMYVYLIGVGIVVLYLYYRHRNSSGSSSSSSTGGYIQPTPTQGTDVVPSGNANTTTGDTGSGNNQPVDFPSDYVTQTDFQAGLDSINSNVAQDIASITFPTPNIYITNPTGPDSATSKATSASKTAAKAAAPSAPFGGVVSTRKTKTGAIITTYRSGRIIEKAPGKSAFVVHK